MGRARSSHSGPGSLEGQGKEGGLAFSVTGGWVGLKVPCLVQVLSGLNFPGGLTKKAPMVFTNLPRGGAERLGVGGLKVVSHPGFRVNCNDVPHSTFDGNLRQGFKDLLTTHTNPWSVV